MEKTIHEVVFNSLGVPDNYVVGTIRQGTKNVDQLYEIWRLQRSRISCLN